MLTVAEVFRSIQGETTFAGWPSSFVRLAGCNLRCAWCDTAYAWEAGEPWEQERLLAFATEGPRLVTVTGGEPLFQAETPRLVAALLDAGHTVVVETNGSLPVDALDGRSHRVVDLKPPSSGETGTIRWANLDLLTPRDQVKVVVADAEDFRWACELIAGEPRLRGVPVNLTPAHGRLAARELAEMLLAEKVEARLNCQLHRILWPGEERGR